MGDLGYPVHVRKVYDFCMLCMVLVNKHRTFLFQIKFVCEDMCHELDQGSVVQVQGHYLKKCFIPVGPYLVGNINLTQRLIVTDLL